MAWHHGCWEERSCRSKKKQMPLFSRLLDPLRWEGEEKGDACADPTGEAKGEGARELLSGIGLRGSGLEAE